MTTALSSLRGLKARGNPVFNINTRHAKFISASRSRNKFGMTEKCLDPYAYPYALWRGLWMTRVS